MKLRAFVHTKLTFIQVLISQFIVNYSFSLSTLYFLLRYIDDCLEKGSIKARLTLFSPPTPSPLAIKLNNFNGFEFRTSKLGEFS